MNGVERARAAAPQGTPDRVDHLELRDRLSQCSSEFHALLYIAGYWNPATALYHVPGERRILSAEETSVVRALHSTLFERWLRTSVAEQHQEFQGFLTTMKATEQAAFLCVLRSSSAPDAMVPPDATAEQRALFFSNLRTLVTLAEAAASVDPDAGSCNGGR
jgi:hypothetical protein